MIDIERELNSDDYKREYDKLKDICSSLNMCLFFVFQNCARDENMPQRLFFLFIIDEILHSCGAIQTLASDGIRNTCRRELRFVIELAIKASYISQKYTNASAEEQLKIFEKELKSTNISMVDKVGLFYLNSQSQKLFSHDIKRLYGEMSNYVHATPVQIAERLLLNKSGRTIGFEGVKELYELNSEISRAFSYILVLLFHSIPQWCVGDYFVNMDGSTINSFFTKSKYIAEIDSRFDYKAERQLYLSTIIARRESNIEF